MQLLLAMVILGLGWLGIKAMARANPKNVKANMRKFGGIAAIGLSIILTLRGGLPIAIPLFFVGLGLLGYGHLAGIELPWSNKKSSGQTSHVRTSMLMMLLDHDSGRVNGEVLHGAFAGRLLSDLNVGELQQLYLQCANASDQSLQLLEAFLDTNHADWREQFGYAAGEGAPPSSGSMTTKEAFALLGLEQGASQRAIISAHRRLMKKYHPDHGGTDYIAAKINQAKDVLLDEITP